MVLVGSMGMTVSVRMVTMDSVHVSIWLRGSSCLPVTVNRVMAMDLCDGGKSKCDSKLI